MKSRLSEAYLESMLVVFPPTLFSSEIVMKYGAKLSAYWPGQRLTLTDDSPDLFCMTPGISPHSRASVR